MIVRGSVGNVEDRATVATRLKNATCLEAAAYLVAKPDPLIATDVNEPNFSRRVPGTVIYSYSGDRR